MKRLLAFVTTLALVSMVGSGALAHPDSLFMDFQSIPTNGAIEWESFTIDGETYLAVCNNNNGSTPEIDSRIYKWNGVTFVYFQGISTFGAIACESFTINGETYLAVANYSDRASWRGTP